MINVGEFLDFVNQTAQNIKVKHLEPLPPTKMEDFLNPAAGAFVYATDNAFEQQLYTSKIFKLAICLKACWATAEVLSLKLSSNNYSELLLKILRHCCLMKSLFCTAN